MVKTNARDTTRFRIPEAFLLRDHAIVDRYVVWDPLRILVELLDNRYKHIQSRTSGSSERMGRDQVRGPGGGIPGASDPLPDERGDLQLATHRHGVCREGGRIAVQLDQAKLRPTDPVRH